MSTVDLMLINPHPTDDSPFYVGEKLPPLGLAFLASVLRKNGFEVGIFDNYLFRKSVNEVVKIIKRRDPSMVGITCSSMTYQPCVRLAEKIKEELSVPIVVGGPHPTVLRETMLQHSFIDYVVLGEGEYTLLELVKALSKEANPDKVKGLAYKKDDETIYTGRRPFIRNLDALPHPARDLLPMSKYPRKSQFLSVTPVSNINSSRGCPYGCRFCSVRSIWGRRYRCFSPKWVLDEIEELVNTYRTKGIYFREDNFTVDKQRVVNISNGILDRELDIKWVCESRVDLVSESLLEKMWKSGCESMWFGIESGSHRVLNYLNKGITLEQIKNAVQMCKKVGIKVGASFIIGLPCEDPEEMKKTLALAKKLEVDWCWFNIFVGIPFSPLYMEIMEKKQYSHVDDNYLVYVKTEKFDYETMKRIKEEFVKAYMRGRILKPNYMMRRLLKVRSPKEMLQLTKHFFHYLFR